MTGSFVRFRDRVFEAKDVVLQIWMFYVVQEARSDPEPSDWKQEFIGEWSDVAASTALGTVWTRLDYFADEAERREKLLQYAEGALDRLHSEEKVSIDVLTRAGIGGEVRYYEDIPSELVSNVGDKFVRLLRGEPLDE